MKLSLYRIALFVMVSLPSLVCAQESGFGYKARRVLMDSTWDRNNEPVVEGIINFYKPEMDRLMQQVIGVSEHEMRSGRPESLLSNFAADAMLEYGRKVSSRGVDFSLTNFGGLRASLPKGEVKRYDVFSIFPFENYIVVLDLPGTAVREMFESFAKNRVEAFSHNIKLEITDNQLKDVLLEGEQIDPYRTYRVVTIDFLMGGGDNLIALKSATDVEYTGVLLRDAILEIIESRTKAGEKLTSSITKRVVAE
ncbi:MAG: 5'-nucleotidase C-terminal domain-containing protein [Bacteroidales bacterium]|jgi:2',3'-cyclic-nucleotide 2'-phosphodiesterase (5'-nucleotidase family)